MSDILMLTGPNGGELVFDIDNGTIAEKLTGGNLGEPQLYLHGERICSESDFLRVKNRQAALEAELATARHQAAYCEDETKQALAERAALALIIKAVQARLTTTKESPQWTWVDFNYMVENIRGLLSDCDCQAILAAHNAEVARKAKVEALEAYRSWMWELGYPDETEFMREARSHIAALKAEGSPKHAAFVRSEVRSGLIPGEQMYRAECPCGWSSPTAFSRHEDSQTSADAHNRAEGGKG